MNGMELWAYDSDRCDGDYCPCNCDICRKAEEQEEDEAIEDLEYDLHTMEMDGLSGTQKYFEMCEMLDRMYNKGGCYV